MAGCYNVDEREPVLTAAEETSNLIIFVFLKVSFVAILKLFLHQLLHNIIATKRGFPRDN